MTTNPCTSCKHYKQGHICALTSESTSQSRAYKTDKDDCFQYGWGENDTNKAKEEQKEKMQEMTDSLNEACTNGVSAIDLRDGNMFNIKAKDIRKNLTNFIEQNEK